MDDCVSALVRALADADIEGPVNITAPRPVRMQARMRTLFFLCWCGCSLSLSLTLFAAPRRAPSLHPDRRCAGLWGRSWGGRRGFRSRNSPSRCAGKMENPENLGLDWSAPLAVPVLCAALRCTDSTAALYYLVPPWPDSGNAVVRVILWRRWLLRAPKRSSLFFHAVNSPCARSAGAARRRRQGGG